MLWIALKTLGCETVWEVLLTLVSGVGSLLRASQGPKTTASLAIPGSPYEGEPWEGKHKQ